MDFATLLLTLILFVFSFGSFYILYRYLRVNRFNPRGKGAEKHTRKVMQRYAVLHNYRTLSDLTFSLEGELIPVENVLVGYFGVLLVNTCGARGGYYGKVEDPEWIFLPEDDVEAGERESMPNPLYELNKAIRALRMEFADKKIYKVGIERAVVISNTSKKTAVYVTQEDLVFRKKELKGYLNRVKFDQDAGVAVDKVADAILEYSKRNEQEKP